MWMTPPYILYLYQQRSCPNFFFQGIINLEKDIWWVSFSGKLNHFGSRYLYLTTWKWDSTIYVLQNCLLHLGMVCWRTSTKNTSHCVPFGIHFKAFFVSLAVLQSKYRGKMGRERGQWPATKVASWNETRDIAAVSLLLPGCHISLLIVIVWCVYI